jgi:homoserine trans-succinylase
MDEFASMLGEVLPQAKFKHDDFELSTLDAWDSMSQLVIASWIHRETGHLVSTEEIKQATTIRDLKSIYASKI